MCWWLCCAGSSALLGLLVVGCFECFGSAVKFAEESWLLETGFYVIFAHSWYLGHVNCYFVYPKAIMQAWCLHLTILGVILSACGRPGRPWEQQERHVGFRRQIFSDFGMILGAHFERLLGLDGSNSVFLLGLVSKSFFASIFEWNY